MEKLKAVIIDGNDVSGEETKKAMDRVSKNLGLGIDTKRYSKLDDLERANLYIIEGVSERYEGKGVEKAEAIARKISKENPKSKRILIRKRQEYNPEMQEQRGLWNGIVLRNGEIDTKKLEQEVCRLREEGSFVAPIDMGIHGYGRFGREGLKSTLSSPVRDIKLYSRHYIDHNPEGYRKIKDAHSTDRIKAQFTLDNLLESIDVLFIATGLPFDPKRTRREEFNGTARLIYPVLEKARDRDYQGLIIIGSNPTEDLLKLAQEMGIDPRQLVGESVTDSVRLRKLLAERFIHDPEITEKDINVRVLGSHQQSVPILSSATVHGRPITDYLNFPMKKYSDFNDFRKGLTRILRRIRKKVMTGSKESGDFYSDAPRGFKEMIKDITCLKQVPRSCWSVYDSNNGYYFTNSVARIEYPSLRVTPLKTYELDDLERKELEKQRDKNSRKQRKLVGDFLLEHGRK